MKRTGRFIKEKAELLKLNDQRLTTYPKHQLAVIDSEEAGEAPALQLQSSNASLDDLEVRRCLASVSTAMSRQIFSFFLIPSRSARTVAPGVRCTYGMGFRFRMSRRCAGRGRHGFSLRRASDQAETETPGAHDQIKDCFHSCFFL
jgi:hypothetical protein